MHNTCYDLNSKAKISKTELFFTLIYIFASTLHTSGSSTVFVVVFLLYAIVILKNSDTCNFVCRDIKTLCLLTVCVMTICHGLYVAGVVYTFKQVASLLRLYSPIMIFIHFKKPERRSQLKLILKCSFWIILFFCFFSLTFYTLFPGAARNARDYVSLIGGGYGLACAVTILSVFFFGLLANGFFFYSKKTRNIVLISCFIMLFTVFKTESTLTLLIAVIGIVSSYYFKKNNKRSFYARMLILPIALIAFIVFLPSIGRSLISISIDRMNTSQMFKRINSLGNLLLYGTDNPVAQYSVNRFLIPFTTFVTFLKNPLFGVAYKHGCGYYRPYNFGVGNHCEFVDALANYGVVGGIPFLMMYISQVAEILKMKIPHPSKAWIFVLILLGLFNPLRYFQVNFVLFFFIPAFCLLHEDIFKNAEAER